MLTQVERDKMRAIEAQIRASQLARFAMRSAREEVTHSKNSEQTYRANTRG